VASTEAFGADRSGRAGHGADDARAVAAGWSGAVGVRCAAVDGWADSVIAVVGRSGVVGVRCAVCAEVDGWADSVVAVEGWSGVVGVLWAGWLGRVRGGVTVVALAGTASG